MKEDEVIKKIIDILKENGYLNDNKSILGIKEYSDSAKKIYEDIVDDYRDSQYDKTVETLNKLAELIAFINTYGPLYDKHYEGFIINLNNVSEHFLQSSNSKVIDELYALYSSLRELKKSKQEIFEALQIVLCNLPAFEIVETSTREKRHKKKTYSLERFTEIKYNF